MKVIVFKWEIWIATCARLWVPMVCIWVCMGCSDECCGCPDGCSWVRRWVDMGVMWVFKAWFQALNPKP